MARLFFLLFMLFGVGAGVVYPWMANNVAGREIGRWQVYERPAGFVPVTLDLPATNAPIRAFFDIRLNGPLVLSSGGSLLTITGAVDGQTVLARSVAVTEITTRLVDPQSAALESTFDLGTVANPKAGSYVFTTGPGDVEAQRLERVWLRIEEGLKQPDDYAQPVGFAAMAIGFIGLVLSFRRSSRPANPNTQPQPPKWGRGG